MKTSAAVKSAASGEDVHGERQKQAKRALKVKAKADKKKEAAAKKAAKAKLSTRRVKGATIAVPRSSMGNKDQDRPALVIEEAEEVESSDLGSFLFHWTATKDYLLKIDSSQVDKISAFESIAIACSMGLKPQLTVNSRKRIATGWCDLRKLYKLEFYRTKALQPRTSDPDFIGTTLEQAIKDIPGFNLIMNFRTNSDMYAFTLMQT